MEGLAYDWIGKNIYWTDNIRNTLEVMRYDGQHRKVLISGSEGIIDRPRGIAVDPARGWVKLINVYRLARLTIFVNYHLNQGLDKCVKHACSQGFFHSGFLSMGGGMIAEFSGGGGGGQFTK